MTVTRASTTEYIIWKAVEILLTVSISVAVSIAVMRWVFGQ